MADLYWDDVVLLSNAESGSVDDVSQSGHVLTTNGTVSATAGSKKFGTNGFDLSTTTAAIVSPSDSDFTFGTGDYTIEFWYYHVSGSNPAFADNRLDGAGDLVIYDSDGGATITPTLYIAGADRAVGSAISSSTWYHMAVTRRSGTARFFIDGVQQGSDYSDSTNYTSTQFVFGNNYLYTGNATSYMDDIRVTKGAARYTSNFTAPVAAFPTQAATDPDWDDVTLLIQSDTTDGSTTFTDSSETPGTITAGGNTQHDTAQAKWRASSILFDGTDDDLEISLADAGLPAAGATYTEDFTVEFWMRWTGSLNYLTGTRLDSVTTEGWVLRQNANGSIAAEVFNNNSVTANPVSATGVVTANTWHHIALTYVHSTTTWTIWVDGSDVANATGACEEHTSSTSLHIGTNQNENADYGGWIDDYRLTVGTARYTGTFSVPEGPFPTSGPGSALAADAGSFSYSGGVATLTYTTPASNLSADGGTFTYSGGNANLVFTGVLGPQFQKQTPLVDVKKQALKDLGYDTDIPTATAQYLVAQGATAGKPLPEMWYEVLIGINGAWAGLPLPAMWRLYLSGEGYEGTIDRQEYQFWENGGF